MIQKIIAVLAILTQEFKDIMCLVLMCLYSFPEVFSLSTQKKTPLTEVFDNRFYTILPYSSYIIFEQLFTDDDSNLVRFIFTAFKYEVPHAGYLENPLRVCLFFEPHI